jgi:hypothetical protein
VPAHIRRVAVRLRGAGVSGGALPDVLHAGVVDVARDGPLASRMHAFFLLDT